MGDFELRSARYLALEAQQAAIRAGDTVIDATLGNGHDTLRLAQLVGEQGLVIGFDIQPEAVRSTRKRLEEAGMAERCELHLTGHEHMAEVVQKSVRCVVFNLGWLPGGDKHITTQWLTTEKAVAAALGLLEPMGVCTLCVYPGHREGAVELENLTSFLSSLKPQEFNVLRQEFLNAGPGAPVCFVIQKQASAANDCSVRSV